MYKLFVALCFGELRRFVECCNEVGDEIVAVTQNGEKYTVIYKLWEPSDRR